MTQIKKVMANTLVVEQDDPCKYIYFINYGQFTVLRNIQFIDTLTKPLRQQLKLKEG